MKLTNVVTGASAGKPLVAASALAAPYNKSGAVRVRIRFSFFTVGLLLLRPIHSAL
jgi:hypothetical protein